MANGCHIGQGPKQMSPPLFSFILCPPWLSFSVEITHWATYLSCVSYCWALSLAGTVEGWLLVRLWGYVLRICSTLHALVSQLPLMYFLCCLLGQELSWPSFGFGPRSTDETPWRKPESQRLSLLLFSPAHKLSTPQRMAFISELHSSFPYLSFPWTFLVVKG